MKSAAVLADCQGMPEMGAARPSCFGTKAPPEIASFDGPA
jgi:hypothetical protein